MFRPARTERFLATILFTDIVGSTDLAAKLGDRAWRRVVAAHHAAVRHELRRFGGRELDTAGDGFFATFGQPAQAVHAADAIVSAVAKVGVSIRAGLHTGEAEAIGQKLGGIAVHTASRILSQASPGEVLVSGTLHDLVAGSGLEFVDRGVHELKGIPGEWHLWGLVRAASEVDEAAVGSIVRVPEPFARSWGRPTLLLVAGGSIVGVLVVAAAVGSTLFFRPSPSPAVASPAPPSFALEANTVVELDPTSGRVVDVRRLGGGPKSIAVDHGAVWVAAIEAGLVVRLDLADRSSVQTVGRAGRPGAIAIGNGIVWVADSFDDNLSLLDDSTGDQRQVIPKIHLRQIAYGFDSLWGTDDIHDRLLRFDRQTGEISGETSLTADSYPTGLAVGSDAVWVANQGNRTLSRIDPASGRILADGIALRAEPDGVAAIGNDVWVTSRASDLLMRVDAATNAAATTLPICDGPGAVAADTSGIWVGCTGTGQVWHLNREGKVLAQIDVGGRPTRLAIAGGRVWVAVATP